MDILIQPIVDNIVRICHPRQVILHAEKRTMSTGDIKALSFCVITDSDTSQAIRMKLHLAVSADVPVGLIVYSPDEWQRLLQDSGSYASCIAGKGQVVYAQTT